MRFGFGFGFGFNNMGSAARALPTERDLLCQAIAGKVCTTATHNRTKLVLAPHILYRRGTQEVPMLDAIVVERAGKPVKDAVLRTFTVSALSGLAVTDRPFVPSPSFKPDNRRYLNKTICAVEVA